MRFIHNQDVKVSQPVVRPIASNSLAKHAQRVFALQVIHGPDEVGKVGPRVRVQASLPAQALDAGAVHDHKRKAELVKHLVAPLDLQGNRANNQHAVSAMSKQQFRDGHAGLDRLAKAHTVGNEEVDPGHFHGPDDWVELVAFDLNAAAEGRLELAVSAMEAALHRTASRKASR